MLNCVDPLVFCSGVALDATRTEATRNGSDAVTVADLDLQHGAFLGTRMTAMLSHTDTLICCGAFHLEVKPEDSQAIVSGGQASHARRAPIGRHVAWGLASLSIVLI